MDQISLKIDKDNEGKENVQIFINGVSIIDILKRIEFQYDKSIAGQYKGLPPEIVFYPSKHFIGLTHEELDYHDDKSAILICECGCAGCWDFIVKISITDQTVTWSEFEQPHRGPESASGHWNYEGLLPFVFDRKQYESELKNKGL
ncbi:MAG TPA: hypothetical protein VJ546_02125 [Bacillales bacterium]|nr:hypothetical protein [Bacillales bacterium]